MTKIEYLSELKKGLAGLPEDDVMRSLEFYGEMIDDRIDEGLTEEEAVADIGEVKDAIAQILSEIPLGRIIKEKVKLKRKLRAWEIILLSVGSPIWLSLLIAAFAVVLSVCVSLWAVIVSLWAVFVGTGGSSLGFIAGGIYFLSENPLSGILVIGVGIACIGLAILMFFACRASTKGMVWLTKKLALCIKNCFIKREVAK